MRQSISANERCSNFEIINHWYELQKRTQVPFSTADSGFGHDHHLTCSSFSKMSSSLGSASSIQSLLWPWFGNELQVLPKPNFYHGSFDSTLSTNRCAPCRDQLLQRKMHNLIPLITLSGLTALQPKWRKDSATHECVT